MLKTTATFTTILSLTMTLLATSLVTPIAHVSPVSSATPANLTTSPVTPSWPPGSSLTYASLGPRSLNLTWTSATDASLYRINKNGTLFRTVDSSGHTLRVVGLTQQTTYNFKVEAGDYQSNWTTDGPSMTVTTPQEPAGYDFNITIAPSSIQIPQTTNRGILNVTLSSHEGFVGLVSISTTVISSTGNGPVPSVGYTATTVYLGELRTVETFYINLLTTNVPLGSYALTVKGVNGDLSHEASATIQVVSQLTGPEARLFYQLGYEGYPTPGNTISFTNNFTNTGQVKVRVILVSYSWDLGLLNTTISGLPFTLNPGEQQTLSLNMTIPTTARPGNHAVKAEVYWEYYNGQWLTADPIHVNGTLTIPGNVSTGANQILTRWIELVGGSRTLLFGLAGYALVVAVISALVIQRERRKQAI